MFVAEGFEKGAFRLEAKSAADLASHQYENAYEPPGFCCFNTLLYELLFSHCDIEALVAAERADICLSSRGMFNFLFHRLWCWYPCTHKEVWRVDGKTEWW